MANDGSLASLTEEWIATQLRALSEFADDAVEVFEGTTHLEGAQLIEELTAERSPHVFVFFEGDVPRPLEEGDIAYEPTYGIYVMVINNRAGAARKGDGTKPGTNKMRDVIRTALHDKRPDQSAGGYYTDMTEFRGTQIVFQRKDAFIMRAELVVRETVAAG